MDLVQLKLHLHHKLITPYVKKDGTLSKRGLTQEEYESFNGIQQKDFELFGGKNTYTFKPFMRQKLQHFNLGSRKQIGEYLTSFGWKPERFTPTGQPIVDEGTLKKIKHIPEANLIRETYRGFKQLRIYANYAKDYFYEASDLEEEKISGTKNAISDMKRAIKQMDDIFIPSIQETARSSGIELD